jgi:predicted RND superfamily exporter protein
MPVVIDSIVNLIVRAHRPILIVSAAFALVSVVLLFRPGLREDYRIESMVAANDEAYQRYRRFGEQFISGEMALFVVDAGDPLEPNNLELLHWICGKCREIEGVESPLAVSELPQLGLGALFGSMGRVQTVYERLKEDPSARSRIESELRNNPLVMDLLLGRDARTGQPSHTAGIVVQVAGESSNRLRKEVAEGLRRVAAEARRLRPDATILLGGPLTGLMEIFEAIHRDLVVFSVVVFVLICIALILIMRRISLVAIIVAAASVSSLCILGFSIASRMAMSLVSQTVVIVIVVQAVSMCIHLLLAHEETRLHRVGPVHGPLHDVRQTLHWLLVPCFLCALTTVVGFGSLLVSELQPIRHLAVLGSAGVVLALLLGAAALPALCRVAARRPPIRHDVGRLSDSLAGIAGRAGAGGTYGVVVMSVFSVLLVLAAVKVPAALRNFESDFVKNFRENSNIRRVYSYVEQHLGPVGSIEVIVRRKDGTPVIGQSAMEAMRTLREQRSGTSTASSAGEQSPSNLKSLISRQLAIPADQTMAGVSLMQAVDEFQQRIEQEFNPPVRKTFSLVDLIKQVSLQTSLAQVFGLGRLQLPLFESEFALKMLLIDQKLSPEFLRHFITKDGRALRINLRATESDSVYHKLEITRRVQATAVGILGPEYTVEVTGLYPLYAKITVDLLGAQMGSFGLALVFIGACMCISLRSLRLGLISMVPNVIPMVLCLGVMGWANIPISMATAMMLSIALGIAVDNTLHYLWRFRRELAVDQDYPAAIMRSHRTVGMACLFNSIVIIGGFWVLCLSEFVPTIYFGLLIGLTMMIALASIVLLLPVLLLVFRPVPVNRFEV